MQIKIAFYIPLSKSKDVLSNANLKLGNPGVGGTQYLFLITVQRLNEINGTGYAVLISDAEFGVHEKNIPYVFAQDEIHAIKYCESCSISTLIINANAIERFRKNAFTTNIDIYLWAHNTLSWKRQQLAAEIPAIKRVVCVSRSQFENMKTTPCSAKCVYINNVFTEEFYRQSQCTDYSKRKVIYVGSIMPQKGVHNLLEIWRLVEKEIPDAQLFIFGGANVWNPAAKLGKNTSADFYYDKVIRRRKDKLIHPENIHFMGAKGWREIEAFIRDARVGVVNPSYYMRDETFCMSAIEMEAHGLPVVSRQRGDGLRTTIKHLETGYLEKRNADIAKRIILLLNNKQLCKQMGQNARNYVANFLIDKEVTKWSDLITEKKDIKNKSFLLKFKSKDALLLDRDMLLRILFLLESGKMFDLVKKNLFRR